HADQIQVLIASVPDPVDTLFGFWYDHLIESLTRVVCDAGYAPAGHWTPWEQYRFGQNLSDGDKKTVIDPSFTQYPGVLLFHERERKEEVEERGKRKEQKEQQRHDRVLAVLLVGETPNGIQAIALARALDLAEMVQLQRAKPDPSIRLVAPFFTGAQRKLEQTLQEWRD